MSPTDDDVSSPTLRPPRIQDVARVAGVSVPTVSRVLTGAARVSPERRERVLRAIEGLSFRPSGTARALVRGKNEIIAVMTSRTAVYGYSATIEGIETAARAAGYFVIIYVIDSDDAVAVGRAIELVLGQPLAGVIVLKFDVIGEKIAAALPREVHVVAASGDRDLRLAQAMIDESSGGEAVTRYLLGLGHTTVHHVSVPQPVNQYSRTAGWRRALEAAGAPVPETINAAAFDARMGVPIGHHLAQVPDLTAVFAGNDEVAMGVIAGLADAGLSVPDDVSVVGFDDHPLAAVWRPGLTTVAQDFPALGEQAFAMLSNRFEGDTTPTLHTQQPVLIVRASAAAPTSTRSTVGATSRHPT